MAYGLWLMAIALLHFVSFYTFSVKLPDIQVIVNQTDKLLVQQSDSATLIYLNTGDLNVKYRPRLCQNAKIEKTVEKIMSDIDPNADHCGASR